MLLLLLQLLLRFTRGGGSRLAPGEDLHQQQQTAACTRATILEQTFTNTFTKWRQMVIF